jgi:hypothetical protein
MSFGYLVAGTGNDTFEAHDYAQGAGYLGVGALLHRGGTTAHQAHSYAQGAGQLGYGLAVDLAGTSSWHILSNGQGYGYSRSVGLLLDVTGDNVYDADDTNITEPSPQDAKHNVSNAQGAGYGARDQMSGGTGMLVHLSGNASYSCGLFCQGSGYWFATGILYNGSGHNTYRGVWYVQGAAAHFAFGVLIDESGGGNFLATEHVSQGAGHDGSAGYLLAGPGDDSYGGTALSTQTRGVANDVAFGLFVDAGGNDTYNGDAGISYGQTNSEDLSGSRPGARSLAVFLDLAGEDKYVGTPPEIGNGKTWKLPGQGWAPPEHVGFGQDLASG